jgi:hypothetical protein
MGYGFSQLLTDCAKHYVRFVSSRSRFYDRYKYLPQNLRLEVEVNANLLTIFNPMQTVKKDCLIDTGLLLRLKP